MNEGDKTYMELNKSEPKEITPCDYLYTYGYIAGCALAFVFWIWFIIWAANKI